MSAATPRLATAQDANQLAELYVQTLRDAYAGEMPADFVNPIGVAARATKFQDAIAGGTRTWFVSPSGSRIVAFCGLSSARDADLGPGSGEITAIAVDSAHRREGHGRALLRAAQDEAARRGWRELVLWVVASNLESRAFYESVGFETDGATQIDERLGFRATLVRYRLALAAV